MTRTRVPIRLVLVTTMLLLLSSVFSGAAHARDSATFLDSESRVLQQTEISASHVCRSIWTNQLRLTLNTMCTSSEQLIDVAAEMPFDYCYSAYTGIMSDDLSGDQCPGGSQYVVVAAEASFFVCMNPYTGRISHMASLESPCSGATAFFTDLRGDITKYACVEENLNADECDVFPAGPRNEIRQIGPMPHTGGGFGDITWRWEFDGNTSSLQRCVAADDCENSEIEAALEALPGINSVTVTGGPIAGTVNAPIRIEFVDADAQTDIGPRIAIRAASNTINQSDTTVVDGAANGAAVSYAMPGGAVRIFEAPPGTDPNDSNTYGPEVTAGPQLVDADGKFEALDLLEGDYVVCATGSGAVTSSCEIVTVFDNEQTLVNNVDLRGTISAEITDTVGGNEIRSYDDVPLAGGNVNGGTYTITFDTQTTDPIPYNADAAAVQSALVDLSNIADGDVSVTGGPPNEFAGPPIVIEFTGAYAGMDVPDIVIDSNNLTGGRFAGYYLDPNLTDRDGFGTVQTFTADARVSGGSFTLTYDNGTTASTTAALDFDASVNEIEAALNGLASISAGGGSVALVSTDPGIAPGNESITSAPILVRFVNVTNSDTNVLEVDNSNLN